MVTITALPLVKDPRLAWTGKGFGRELRAELLSRTIRVGVNVRMAHGAGRISKNPFALRVHGVRRKV